MKRFLSICLLLTMLVAAGCENQKSNEFDYDVIVYGGNSAGVIAAYTASKKGKSVLLIEPSMHIGGLSSGGLGYTDIGNKYAISGLSLDFYRKLGKHYGKFEQWVFEPHVAQNLFMEYLGNSDVTLLKDYRIISANTDNGLIRSIDLELSSAPAKESNKSYSAKMFIDCTYEGDLMAMAGVSYSVGREANSEYGETFNGVQLMKGHQFPDGIDPYKVKGDPSSGLLWGISDDELEPDGTGDAKLQAYNYRICLTDNPDNRVEIARPEGYDSTKYELLVRLFEAQPERRSIYNYFIWSRMPNQKTDINNRGGFSTDMIGMNYEYPEGGYEKRKQIIDEHVAYTKGLLYFYKTDPRVPKELQDFVQDWGYPRDEYTENDHWSPQLYVREVRRMVGEYVMTQANCEGDEMVEDGIGMAAYTMDSHNCQRIVIEKDGKKMVKNEGNVEEGGYGPYPIAYRSIIPKAAECKNLFVPVCMSASHIAYGSIRMEPVFMVLAQSAATAASMAIDQELTVHEIDVKQLQKNLKEDPLADGSTSEIVVDNDDEGQVEITGDWTVSKRWSYGPSMLIDESKGITEKSVRYFPQITSGQHYEVYVYFVRIPEISSSVHVSINDGSDTHEVLLKNEEIKIEGQTAGEWVSIGRYELPEGRKSFVEISNKNADGNVAADAVLFLPVE